MTKRGQARGHFQNWTSAILNIFSSGYFHKRNVRRHVMTSQRTYIVRGNKSLWRVESKLLGLWLRSSLILLNPCETIQDERRRGNKWERACEGCAIVNWEGHNLVPAPWGGKMRDPGNEVEKGNKRKNVYDARRSIEEAVNKISGEYYFWIQQMLIILALGR